MRLLLDLNTFGSADPLGVFPLFLKKDMDIIAPWILLLQAHPSEIVSGVWAIC